MRFFIDADCLPKSCQNGRRWTASRFFSFTPPDPGALLLLIANKQLLSAPEITTWVDAASEDGVRLQAITDKQFMTFGENAHGDVGLVLPDPSHRFVHHALVWAIRSYTTAGVRTLLVCDFAALEPNFFNRQFYSDRRSRLSDLAGVDYILFDELRDRLIS